MGLIAHLLTWRNASSVLTEWANKHIYSLLCFRLFHLITLVKLLSASCQEMSNWVAQFVTCVTFSGNIDSMKKTEMCIIQFVKKRELLLSPIPKLLQRNVRSTRWPDWFVDYWTLQKLEMVAKFHEREVAICQPILEFVFKNVTLTLGP